MQRAFVEIDARFGELDDLLPGEIGGKVGDGCKAARLARAAARARRAGGDLLRAERFEDHQPAGLQRRQRAGMKEATLVGGEMEIDQRDEVVSLARPGPGERVGLRRVDADAARRGKPARLGDALRRKIERVDDEPLLGEPDAVAPLAVAGNQRPHPRLEARRLSDEKGVGRLAVGVGSGA